MGVQLIEDGVIVLLSLLLVLINEPASRDLDRIQKIEVFLSSMSRLGRMLLPL